MYTTNRRYFLRKKCFKQCRQVTSQGTMSKWPEQEKNDKNNNSPWIDHIVRNIFYFKHEVSICVTQLLPSYSLLVNTGHMILCVIMFTDDFSCWSKPDTKMPLWYNLRSTKKPAIGVLGLLLLSICCQLTGLNHVLMIGKTLTLC